MSEDTYRTAVAAAFAEAGHDPSVIGWAMCTSTDPENEGERGFDLGIRYPHGTDESWDAADQARRVCESLRPADHLPPKSRPSRDGDQHFGGERDCGVVRADSGLGES